MVTKTLLVLCLLCAPFCGGCPSGCRCDGDAYVSCHGNVSLEDLGSPERLRLEDLEGSLEGLRGRRLKELRVERSGVRKVVLAPFPALEVLDLSGNVVEAVEKLDLAPAAPPPLAHLVLRDNRVEVVEEGAFGVLGATLVHLDLSGNRLRRLPAGALAGLGRLQTLRLERNLLAAVDAGAFQDLHDLAQLHLGQNPIEVLDRLDAFGPRLREVDLSGSERLRRVPQCLARSVTTLRLGGSRLRRLAAGDLDSYPLLEALALDSAALEELEEDALGRLSALRRLWLGGNRLRRPPQGLPDSLTALYMERNLLERLDSFAFGPLKHLRRLFLSGNALRDLAPCAFCGLDSLRELELRRNRLEALPEGAFANLSLLQTLDLSQNPLVRLDAGALQGLSGLNALLLASLPSNDTFEMSEEALAPLASLRVLELSDSPSACASVLRSTRLLSALRSVTSLRAERCTLRSLREDLPSFLPALRSLRLSGNRWRCDARLRWLAQWLRTDDVVEGELLCEAPSALAQRPLADLTELDFEEARPRSTLVLRLANLVPLTTQEWGEEEDEAPSTPENTPSGSELPPSSPTDDEQTHDPTVTSPDDPPKTSTPSTTAPLRVEGSELHPSAERISNPSQEGAALSLSGVPLWVVGAAGCLGVLALCRRRLWRPRAEVYQDEMRAGLYFIRENQELLSDSVLRD